MTKQFSLHLDESLFNEAFELVGSEVQTQKALFELALKELISNRKQKNLLDLVGKIEFFDDYDYKALRVGEGDK